MEMPFSLERENYISLESANTTELLFLVLYSVSFCPLLSLQEPAHHCEQLLAFEKDISHYPRGIPSKPKWIPSKVENIYCHYCSDWEEKNFGIG